MHRLYVFTCFHLIAVLFSPTVLAARPNVVLIMADDMGYECMRSNGGETYDTPRLDQLGATGMGFNTVILSQFARRLACRL